MSGNNRNENPFEGILNGLSDLKEQLDALEQSVSEHSKKLEIIKQTHPYMLTIKDSRDDTSNTYCLNDSMANKISQVLEEYHKEKDPITDSVYLITEEEFAENSLEQLKMMLGLDNSINTIQEVDIDDSFWEENDDILLEDIDIDFDLFDDAPKSCSTKCEFYNCCYGYEENCIICIINDILGTLTPREEKVLRLRFGLDDGKYRSLESVGREFDVTRERIRQIEAKALRKLRHPSRSKKIKKHFDGILLSGNEQYSRLIGAIFGGRLVEDTELLLDCSIVDKEKCLLQKTVEDIKTELNTEISNISFLCQYIKAIKSLGVNNLSHLLYIPVAKLKEVFNDVEIIQMENEINERGYKFHDDSINELPKLALKQLIKDSALYEQEVYNLDIKLLFDLHRKRIFTLGDIIESIKSIIDDINYTDEEKQSINELLVSKGLAFKHNKNEFEYLSKSYIDSLSVKLIDWLMENNYSVCELIDNLTKQNFKMDNALNYIKNTYPQFVIKPKVLNSGLAIEDMDLSVRAYNCLKRAGINTAEDIAERTFEDMMCIRNLGRQALDEVIEKLHELGLTLSDANLE